MIDARDLSDTISALVGIAAIGVIAVLLVVAFAALAWNRRR